MKLFKHKKGHVDEETLKKVENPKSISISEFNHVKNLTPLNIVKDNLETTKNLSLSADYICNYDIGDNLDGNETSHRHIKDELNNRFKKLKSGSMQEGVNSTSDDDYGICVASPSPHISSNASHSKLVSDALSKSALNKKGPSLTNITSHAGNHSSNVPNISIISRNSSENSSLESSSIGTWDSNLNSEYGNQPLNSCEDSEGSSFDLISATNPHHGPHNNANLKYDAAYHKISLKQKNRRSPQNKKPHHLAPMHLVNEFELPSMPEVSADFEHLEEQMIVTKQKENLSKLEKEGKFSCSKLVQSKDDMKNVMNAIELLKTNTLAMEEQVSDFYGASRMGHHSPHHTLEYPEATHQNQVSKMIEEMKMRSSKKRQDERGEMGKGVENFQRHHPAKTGKGEEVVKGTGGGFCLSSFFKFTRKSDKIKASVASTKSKHSPTTAVVLADNRFSPSKAKPGGKEGKKAGVDNKKEKRRLDFFCLKPSNNADDSEPLRPEHKVDKLDSSDKVVKECPKSGDDKRHENENSPDGYNSLRSVSLSMSAMPNRIVTEALNEIQSCATATLDRKPPCVGGKGENCQKNSTVSLNVDALQRAKKYQSCGIENNDKNKNGFFARLRSSMKKRRAENKPEVGKNVSSVLISSPSPVLPTTASTSRDRLPKCNKKFPETTIPTSSKSTLDVRLIVEPVSELARRHSVCETPCVERKFSQPDQGGDDFPLPNLSVRSPLNYNFIFAGSNSPENRVRIEPKRDLAMDHLDRVESDTFFKFDTEPLTDAKEEFPREKYDFDLGIQEELESSSADHTQTLDRFKRSLLDTEKISLNRDFGNRRSQQCSDASETYGLPISTCLFSILTQSSPLYIIAPKSPLTPNRNAYFDRRLSIHQLDCGALKSLGTIEMPESYEFSAAVKLDQTSHSPMVNGFAQPESPSSPVEENMSSPAKFLDILIPFQNDSQEGQLEEEPMSLDRDTYQFRETPQLWTDHYVDSRLANEQPIIDHGTLSSSLAPPITLSHSPEESQSATLRPLSIDGLGLGRDFNCPPSPNLPLAHNAGQNIMSYSVHGLPPLPSCSTNGFSAPLNRSIVPGLRMGCLSPAGTTKNNASPAFFGNSSRCGLRNYSDLICHTRKVSPMLTQRRNNFLETESDISAGENQAQCDVKIEEGIETPCEKTDRGSIISDCSPKAESNGPKQLWLSRETLEFRSEGQVLVEPNSDGAMSGKEIGNRPKTLPAELRSQRIDLLKPVPPPLAPPSYSRPKSYEFNVLSPPHKDMDENRYRSNSVQGKFSQKFEDASRVEEVQGEKAINLRPPVVAPRKRVKDMINTFQKLSSQN